MQSEAEEYDDTPKKMKKSKKSIDSTDDAPSRKRKALVEDESDPEEVNC